MHIRIFVPAHPYTAPGTWYPEIFSFLRLKQLAEHAGPANMCIYVRVCTCAYICVCVCTRIFSFLRLKLLAEHASPANMCVYVRVCMCVCEFLEFFVHMFVFVCVCAFTYCVCVCV